MTFTNKRATANNFKWTPPNVVKRQQRDDPYGHYNNRYCQNNTPPKTYNNAVLRTSDKYHSPTSHTNHTTATTPTQNHHHNNLNKNKTNNKNNNNKTNKLNTKTPSNYLQRKDDILEPLKNVVESLPSFLQSSTQETALVLLNCTDEYERRSEMADFFRQDPSYIPISARIKYNLTASEHLRTDHVYLENARKCEKVVHIAQKLLRKYTFNVVQREVWAAQQHLLHKYIEHGLTVTQMILVFEKFKQKNKYTRIPYTDGYLAKVAFYNYIFTDINNITTYLNCDLNQLVDLLQNRKNLSQEYTTNDDANTQKTTAEKSSTSTNETFTQNLNSTFDYESDNTHPNHTSPTPSDEDTSPEEAQLPPLPPPPKTNLNNQPSVSNNTNINTTHININVTNNNNDTDSSHHNTTNFTTNAPTTTLRETTTKQKQTTSTIINPYATEYKYKAFPTPQKTTTNPTNKNTITPNDKTQTNPTTNHAIQPPTQTDTDPLAAYETMENDETAALTELQKLMENHINSNPIDDNTQQSNTDSNHTTGNTDRDITLETFYTHPPAAELTNKVTEELQNILPKITHNFNSQRKSIDTQEEAANAALAWYHQTRTKQATENVAQAIAEQPSTPSKTLQELIDESINKSITKTSNKIAKTVEKQIRKKSSGPTPDQGQKAKQTSTGPSSTKNIAKPSSTPSPHSSTTNSQDLLQTTNTPPNPSKLITWDDYLKHKHHKTQRMKMRNKRQSQNARNAKWQKPSPH